MLHHCQMKCMIVSIIVLSSFSMCRKQVSQPPPVTIIDEYHELLAVTDSINPAFGGYYVGLPPRYHERIDSFPLLIFLHGLGQMGNGSSELSYLTFDGIGKLLNDKKFPVSFAHGSRLHSFIVVSPQSSRAPIPSEVKQVLERVKGLYRTDKSRIYLSGLSMGARVVTATAAEYPEDYAAIVPIAGVANGPGMDERCRKIAEANLPVWELHNAEDPMADVAQARQFIGKLLEYDPAVKPRFTVFPVYGHDAWTTALDPNYKESGMNIYEWMLQYSR